MIEVQSAIHVPKILRLATPLDGHGSSTPSLSTFLPVKGAIPMDAGGWCGAPVMDVPNL